MIHSVLSNAGINTHEDLLTETFDPETGKLLPPSLTSIDVNLVGQIYVTRCALHFFDKWPDTPCQLVMTSSAGAFFPAPPIYLYCAAKAGVLGLMRGLRSKADQKNFTVNVVAPWLTGKCSLKASCTIIYITYSVVKCLLGLADRHRVQLHQCSSMTGFANGLFQKIRLQASRAPFFFLSSGRTSTANPSSLLEMRLPSLKTPCMKRSLCGWERNCVMMFVRAKIFFLERVKTKGSMLVQFETAVSIG